MESRWSFPNSPRESQLGSSHGEITEGDDMGRKRAKKPDQNQLPVAQQLAPDAGAAKAATFATSIAVEPPKTAENAQGIPEPEPKKQVEVAIYPVHEGNQVRAWASLRGDKYQVVPDNYLNPEELAWLRNEKAPERSTQPSHLWGWFVFFMKFCFIISVTSVPVLCALITNKILPLIAIFLTWVSLMWLVGRRRPQSAPRSFLFAKEEQMKWNEKTLLQLHKVIITLGRTEQARDYAGNATSKETGKSNSKEDPGFEDLRPFNSRRDAIKALPHFCTVTYLVITEEMDSDGKCYSEEECFGSHTEVDYHTVQAYLDLPATTSFTAVNLESAVQMSLIRLRNNRLTNVGLRDSEMRLYGHMVVFASICQYAAKNCFDLKHLNGVPLLPRPGI